MILPSFVAKSPCSQKLSLDPHLPFKQFPSRPEALECHATAGGSYREHTYSGFQRRISLGVRHCCRATASVSGGVPSRTVWVATCGNGTVGKRNPGRRRGG